MIFSVSHIVVTKFCSIVPHNVASVDWHFWTFTVLLWSHHSILIRLKSGLWQGHFNSFIFQPFWCKIVIVFGIIALSHVIWLAVWMGAGQHPRAPRALLRLKCSYFTLSFMVRSMIIRYPGHVTVELTQIIIRSPPCFSRGMRCFCWTTVWILLSIKARQLHFYSFRCSSVNLSCAFILHFNGRVFLLANLNQSCSAFL